MAAFSRALRSCHSVEAELALVAVVLLAWHAVRIPLEGSVEISLEHAQQVLLLEDTLSLDLEKWVIGLVSSSVVTAALTWLYTNVHLPILFGFMAAVRLLAPDRYPRIRTIFVVSFLPAVFVIGLYPLAPPHWLPAFGFGVAPTQAELADGAALFHNSTAAAASQHFGFAVFVAATSIWLFPRSRLAWTTLAYPAIVFVVIVGTGNHYVVDCIVGTLTFALAAAVAALVHRAPYAATAHARAAGVAGVALGYALIVWGFVSLDLTTPASWDNHLPDALVLAAGVTAVLAPRFGAKEALAESS
jgi:hypothetical protein